MLRLTFSLALGLAAPAAAQDIVQDEAMVMRLIFDDCLGYVVSHVEPFSGLAMYRLSPDVEKSLPEAVLKVANRVHVLSDRYYAVWGQDDQTRYCTVQPVLGSPFPALLGVNPTGFLDRLSIRAAPEGLTEVDTGAEFDGLSVNVWREPGGDGQSELRVVVMPTPEIRTGPLLDVGLIIVAAGKDWHRD